MQKYSSNNNTPLSLSWKLGLFSATGQMKSIYVNFHIITLLQSLYLYLSSTTNTQFPALDGWTYRHDVSTRNDDVWL